MNFKDMQKVIHNKTGNIYYVITDKAIDCTNERDGERVVVYTRDGMLFTREYKEFIKKFTAA